MSLTCTETGEYVMHGSRLYVGLPHDGEFMCAISGGVLDRIPTSERRSTPCTTPEDGLNIFVAVNDGEATFRGAYQWSSLQQGQFEFSVSAQAAQKYLPRLWQETRPNAVPTPPKLNVTLEIVPPPSGLPN